MAKYFSHNRPHTRSDFRMPGPAPNSGSLGPLGSGSLTPNPGRYNKSEGKWPLPKHTLDLGRGEYSGGRYGQRFAGEARYAAFKAAKLGKIAKFMTGAAFTAAYFAGEWAGEEFAKMVFDTPQQEFADYPFGRGAPAGFTVVCDVDPTPLAINRKQGWAPGPPVIGFTCGVSTINRANLPYGSAFPSNSTTISMVQSSAGSPWPNMNGRPYWVAIRNTGVGDRPGGYPFGKTLRSLPMPVSAPAPSESVETGPSRSARSAFGWGFTQAINFKFPPKGPPTKVTEPYRDSPPPARTRERKWKLGKGGPVGDAFGKVTEAMDAVDCAVKAAKANGGPVHGFDKRTGHRRWRGQKSKGIYNKAKYIRDNFDVGNPAMVMDFLKCMVANEFTDRAIGGLSSKAGKAFGEASGSPRGVGIKRPPPISF